MTAETGTTLTLYSTSTRETYELSAPQVFFSSDHHLRHANIIRYQHRPYADCGEMEEDLIAKHNAAVSPRDIWICVGDFAFVSKRGDGEERTRELLSRFNGVSKILLMGNHDSLKRQEYLAAGFSLVFDKIDVLKMSSPLFKGTVRLHHRPPFDYMSKEGLPEDVAPHMAYDADSSYRGSVIPCAARAVCGHVHDMFRRFRGGPVINVSTDAWDGRPLELSEIARMLQTGRAEL